MDFLTTLDPLYLIFVAGFVLLGLLVVLMRPGGGTVDLRPLDDRLAAIKGDIERLDRVLREDAEAVRHAADIRAERLRDEMVRMLAALGDQQRAGLDAFRAQLQAQSEAVDQRLAGLAEQVNFHLGRQAREQAEAGLTLQTRLQESLAALSTDLRSGLDQNMATLRQENDAKLEQMRQTVDEKLQGTLEKRLGESFRLVSERLEQVHRGLGEMQTLANGVGDLKRVLTNVKARGIWGEYQLANLLDQMLTPDQFLSNVATRPGSAERVEFAIRLPEGVLLPIDAKFPREDYERLVEASDRADAAGVEDASRALILRIRAFARDIRDKYIAPPHTTDFALLYLPTEGLYAEVLRHPGLFDQIQRDFRVSIVGPTTLCAHLNSLQMGFRTLAIQKRSSEVWQVLGAVKTEFGKYGDVLDKVQKKLEEASRQIDTVAVRRRAIDRRLKGIESLPEADTAAILALDAGTPPGEDDDEAA